LRIVLADQPDAPAYFTYDAVRNTQERPVLDASLERNFRPLTFDAAAAAHTGREHEVGVRLGRIGFDRVAGFLDGGMSALARHPELIVERLRLHPAALTAAPEACLLDVRTPNEHAAGALDRSLHIPLGQLPARRAELPWDRLIVAYCQGGYRSAIAASLLQSWGMEEIADLEGGYAATQALH